MKGRDGFSGVLTRLVLVRDDSVHGLYASRSRARLEWASMRSLALSFYAKVWGQVARGMVFGRVCSVVSSLRREQSPRQVPLSCESERLSIGIFLTFIGLKNAGLIAADPVTFVKLGRLGIPALLTVIATGVSVWLLTRKSALAFLAGIFLATLLGWAFGLVKAPASFFSAPDFQTVFLKLDILGALKLSLLPAIIAILFTDLFDSISTFIG